MKTLEEKYRERVPLEVENLQVDKACEKTCAAEMTSGTLGPCDPTYPDARFFKNPGPAKTGVSRYSGKDDVAYRCWSNLPTLTYGSTPTNYLGDAYALKARDTECYKCKANARARIQLSGAVQPDARFWVGAGAAAVGVLLAVMVKVSRS